MTVSSMKIIYEIHVACMDIALKDTRRRGYRAETGAIRPYFTFVLCPIANIVMASCLSPDEPDWQTLAALLFAVLTASSDRPYGGKPDEIWLDESTTEFAPRLQCLHDNLEIAIKSNKTELHFRGEADRFLETLKQQICEALPTYIGEWGTMQGNGTEPLTLDELEDVMKDCLISYHQRINSETGLSPLLFWQSHCFPSPVDPHLLASLLGEGISRSITPQGIYYQHRLYWHQDLAALAPGTKVYIYPTPFLSRPMTIEVCHQGQWICSAFVNHE